MIQNEPITEEEVWEPQDHEWYRATLVFINTQSLFARAELTNGCTVYIHVKQVRSKTGHFLCLSIGSEVGVRIRKVHGKHTDFEAIDCFVDGEPREKHASGIIQFWSQDKGTFGSVKFATCQDTIYCQTASRFQPLTLFKGCTVTFDTAISERTGALIAVNIKPLS